MLDFLLGYPYPGNIRELENLIEQGVALVVDGVITLDDIIPLELRGTQQGSRRGGRSLAEVVDRAEREAIEAVLQDVDGNKERAEIVVIAEFLPQPLSDEALAKIVEKAIAEAGATEMKDLGNVMKIALAAIAGRTDGKQVSAMVRERLGRP